MKTLIDELATKTKLEIAWKSLNKKNKYSHGASGVTIDNFRQNLNQHLGDLSGELRNGKFKYNPYKAVPIPKGKGNKNIRPIRVPEIKDRIVIKAMCQIIQDELDDRYKLDNGVSFAYIKKKGTRQAIEKLQSLYQEGNTVIFESDIESFFDNINRKKLLEDKVFPFLRDSSLNHLIEGAFQMEMANRDTIYDLHALEFDKANGGVPQGSALSPLLSNICLYDLDQEMIRSEVGFIRYADDFLLLSNSVERIEETKKVVEDKIFEWGLNLHPEKTRWHKTKNDLEKNRFSFLSIRFDGEKIWPEHDKREDLIARVDKICQINRDSSVFDILKRTIWTLEGWINAFHYTDLDRYFKTIDFMVNLKVQSALYKLGWNLRSVNKTEKNVKFLSEKHRESSGIPLCHEILRKIKERNRET